MAIKDKKMFLRRLFLLIILIVIIGFGTLKAFVKIKDVFILKDNVLKDVETIKISSDKDEVAKVFKTGEYISIYEEGLLKIYDSLGQLKEEIDITLGERLIKGNNRYIYIGETLKGILHIYDYNGEYVKSIQFEGPIYNLKLFGDSYIGIALEDNTLFLFDAQGEEVTKLEIPQGEVTDFQLSGNGQVLGVSVLNITDFDYNSNIFLYSLGGRIHLGKKVDKGIIYYLQAVDEDKIMAIGANKYIILAKDDGIVFERELKDVNKIDAMGKDKVVINTLNRSNPIIDTKNRNSIIQMKSSGEEICQTQILGEVLGIDGEFDKILAFSKRTLYLIDDRGDILIEEKVNGDIRDAFWLREGVFALVLKDKIKVMTINY